MYFSTEWLSKHLAGISDEKKRVEETILFITGASDFLNDDCRKLTEELYTEACEKNQLDVQCMCLVYRSYGNRVSGKHEMADRDFMLAVELAKNPGTSFISALSLQMIAFNFWAVGQRETAFEYAYASRRITDEFGGPEPGWSLFQFGVFHFDLKDYDTSLNYFQATIEKAKSKGLDYQLARAHSGIASIMIAKNQLDEAFTYSKLALDGYKACGHKTAESRALNDIGVINKKLGRIPEAEKYLRDALEIRIALNYSPGIITTQMELADLLITNGNSDEAEILLSEALDYSKKTGAKQKAAQVHKLLSDYYKKKGDAWKALENIEKFHDTKSEVAGEESTNRIKSMQQKFATEKSEAEAEIHRLKNVELKTAYNEIEEKNKNILDSIHYAKRIQGALLASEELLAKNLTEHFVVYKPKDIVSGDFYWAHKAKDLFFLAICDCTGHGVPGAFMSLLNSTFLNEAVIEKGLAEPAEILNEVRKQLIAALNPEGSKEVSNDGMDATLLAFDKKTKTLSFASANNPLLLIQNGELKSFNPDKFPVGIYPDYENKPFTNRQLKVRDGDCVYLLTDGFGDQFGGPGGKKFKLRQLKELLLEIHHLPMKMQQEKLEAHHDSWKGTLEQVDDILIAGIRF